MKYDLLFCLILENILNLRIPLVNFLLLGNGSHNTPLQSKIGQGTEGRYFGFRRRSG